MFSYPTNIKKNKLIESSSSSENESNSNYKKQGKK